MKMKKKIVVAVIATIGVLAAGVYGVKNYMSNVAQNKHNNPPAAEQKPLWKVIEGKVVNERFWEQPGFGFLYRIEVKIKEHENPQPYVFIGEEEELRDLEKQINIGDGVVIEDKSTMFSLDLEKVLLTSYIRKK